MAKKQKEEPKVDSETGSLKVKEKKQEQPDGSETKGNVTKVKAKMTKPAQDLSEPTITKVDLSKTLKAEEDAVHGTTTESVQSAGSEGQESGKETEVAVPSSNEAQEQTVQDEETPVLEEVKDTEEVETIEDPKPVLPENVEKLVNFMNDTGGDLNDYIKLNKDYSKLDNLSLLEEYYKQTKPHLTKEEIDFLMEDKFTYDESYDDEKEIKRKKLALKEQVASAKTQLEEYKSKYYEDLKAGSKLTKEQKQAIEFFNRYSKESEENQKTANKAKDTFLKKTDQVFDQKFKGFEYKVGDKRYRFNIKDVNQTKETQTDINNFVKKFLNKDNLMEDAKGYHRGLFTAMNADAVANHFYEQGKADALKSSIAKSKNINMDPRQSHSDSVGNDSGGIKVRVLNNDSQDFKYKIKQK